MAAMAANLARWWAVLGGLVIIAIMIVTSVNVGAFALDRIAGIFGADVKGLPGYEDFVRLAVACAALMFFPYCQLMRGHVAVDLFVSRLPETLRLALERAWLGALVILALFLGYWMAIGMLEARADNAVSRVLGWPIWPFYLPGILSMALWAWIAAVQFLDPPESERAGHKDGPDRASTVTTDGT